MTQFVPYADRMDWLRRHLSPHPKIGEHLLAEHIKLGAGVYSFLGPETVKIYELGICFDEHRIVRFEDIEDVQCITLPELMRAQHDPAQRQLMAITSGTEVIQLRLPLYQYNELWSFLSRVLRVVERQPSFWGRMQS